MLNQVVPASEIDGSHKMTCHTMNHANLFWVDLVYTISFPCKGDT